MTLPDTALVVVTSTTLFRAVEIQRLGGRRSSRAAKAALSTQPLTEAPNE
jgi:hypothetical protein